MAIDPGVKGGVAWLDKDARAHCITMPETEGDICEQLLTIILEVDPASIYVEEVQGFAGKPLPGSAMFKFGRNYGFLLGALAAWNRRVVLVKPAKWQKALGLGTARGMSKHAWKTKLKDAAQRLYPECTVTLATADALLLLEYARTTQPNG